MKSRWILPAVALPLAWVPAASADTIFFLNSVFSGNQPGGTLTATFEDVAVGTVKLTLQNDLVLQEYVSAWYFNFDLAKDPTGLNFSVDPLNTVSATIQTGTNAFKADGDGKYDILFSFPTPAVDRFDAGTPALVYTITGSGITSSSFDFLSYPDGGSGPFQTAAHVQGIGPTGALSGWITTPLPPVMLGGAMLMGLVGLRRARVE